MYHNLFTKSNLKTIMEAVNRKLWVLAVLLILPFSADAASLVLSPPSDTCTVGSDCKMVVRVSSTDSVSAAEGVISFPSDKLEVKSIFKSPSVFNLWIQEPGYSNSKGTVNFEGVVLNPGFTGNGTILTIVFRAKSAGTASLSFSSAQVLANDGLGTNILSSRGKGTLTLVQAPVKEPEPVVKPEPIPVAPPVPVPVEIPEPVVPIPEIQVITPDLSTLAADKEIDSSVSWKLSDNLVRILSIAAPLLLLLLLIGVLTRSSRDRKLSDKKMLFEARVKAYSAITGRIFNLFLDPDITTLSDGAVMWAKLNQLLSEAMLVASHALANLLVEYKVKVFEFHQSLNKKNESETQRLHAELVRLVGRIHAQMRKELHVDNKSVFNDEGKIS